MVPRIDIAQTSCVDARQMRVCTALLLASIVVGCGGADATETAAPAQPAPAEAVAPAEASAAAEEGEQHHAFTGAVDEFHEVLAPLWHAEAGPGRVDATCANTNELSRRADAISDADAPAGARDPIAFKSRAATLVAAVSALQVVCDGDRAEFDARFTAVHDAFHDLTEALGEAH